MASLLEKELRSATGVKGTPTNRQEFLSALTKRLDELPDEKWEDLSKAAQEWTNKAIKEAGAGLKITDFPDITGNGKAEDDDEESEEDTTEEQDMEAATETDAETKPAPKKKKPPAKKAAAPKKEAAKKPAAKKEAAPKKKVAPKAEKKAKPPKEKKSPKIGAQAVTKQLILKNPKISVDDLLEKLKTKGFKPTRSAVSSIRSGFINSLWVIKEAGLIKIEL